MDANRDVCCATNTRTIVRPAELFRRLRDPAPPVAGLILDFGGVLYDSAAWQRWLLRVVHRIGLHTQYTAFFRLWRREYLERVKRGELEFWAAFRLFLLAAGLTHGQIDQVEAAAHAQLRIVDEDIRPFPGVYTTLRQLSDAGVQLTLLCNDCLDMPAIECRLARLHLEHFFSNIVSSRDVVRRSRCCDPWLTAIERMNVPIDRIAYVGCDSAALRIAASYRLRTAAFNHDEDAVADLYIECFDQLLNALPWQSVRTMAG